MDLESAVKSLHEAGRLLIISGITPAQFKSLDRFGVAGMMDTDNLCPDLEFAIARALSLVPRSRGGDAQPPAQEAA